jgi:hypothetical protein
MRRVGTLLFFSAIALAVVGCSASHHNATAPQPINTTTAPPMTAAQRCSDALGPAVVSSAPTTIAKVRDTPVGLTSGRFRDAFQGLSGAQAATLCVLPSGNGCYQLTAVAAKHRKEHLVKACGPLGPAPSPASILIGMD